MEASAIILAGGKSERMGTDKALLPFWEKPFIEHVVAKMRKLTNRVLISANNDAYDYLKLLIVRDEHEDVGPLAGILAGLNASQTDSNYIIACDTPLVPTELFWLLETEIEDDDLAIVVRHNERTQPLIGIYRKGAVPHIEAAIAAGERSLNSLLEKLGAKIVDVNEEMDFYSEYLFLNANTPNEYELLKEMEQRIKILYFGITGEIVGKSEDFLADIDSVEALKASLFLNYPKLKEQPFKVAVNQVLVNDALPLRSGDEVALLPPFAGG